MNNKTQLLEQEEYQNINRLAKGQEIYNQGLVSKLEGDIFIVKDKYQVEDISTETTPIYVCSCPDFEYRSEYLCKHIFATILYQLDNKGIGA